jgi:uncharacterized membrane protein
MTKTLLTLSVVTAGLMAGLFAAFGYAVMPGLRRTGDAAFVGSMRGINQAILNPVFGVLFGGTLVLLVASAVAVRHDGAARGWVLLGLVLYVATLAVTLEVNVPLNNRLEAGSGSPKALRLAFENRWVAWNIVRAVLSTGSFAAITVALLVR